MRLLVAVLFLISVAMPRAALAETSDFEQRVVDLVNAERARSGLPALASSAQLQASAQAYALQMANTNTFGHVGPDGSTLVTRDEAAGYTSWTWLGENLAAGQSTPEKVMSDWMNSPGHRANILTTAAREIGIGYVYKQGTTFGHYWVQEFGTRPAFQQKLLLQTSPSQSGGWLSPATGHSVQGEWLQYFTSKGFLDTLGHPRSEVVRDPLTGQTVQYFQRMILEWHPENPPAERIQRRLLADILYPGADPPLAYGAVPAAVSHYFPFTPNRPTGLGHFVSDYAPSGQPIYFKQFFDTHGGVGAFGYPKEEPKLRGGMWTQRFQAAVFEYHPEHDVDGLVPGTTIPRRNYRVQLELLGDKYIALNHLNP